MFQYFKDHFRLAERAFHAAEPRGFSVRLGKYAEGTTIHGGLGKYAEGTTIHGILGKYAEGTTIHGRLGGRNREAKQPMVSSHAYHILIVTKYLHVRSGIDIGERVWREKWLGEIGYGCDTDVIPM